MTSSGSPKNPFTWFCVLHTRAGHHQYKERDDENHTSTALSLMAAILFFSSLGLLTLLKISYKLLNWLYITFLRSGKDLKAAYGPWAVLTGATDGIGKALAFELARHGLHLVIVGRSPFKLRDVTLAIQAKYRNTKIETVVVDFAGDVAVGMRRLKAAVGGREVGLLVNGAGATYDGAAYFDEVEEWVWGDVVRVNAVGTTLVTRVVVEGMVERRRGAVVNVGSGAAAAVPSFPLYAVYAATKAYVDQLSRSLYVEYRDLGIDVQCQIPLYVATKMVPFKQHSVFTPSPEEYARAAVRWIGNEPRCTPYWPHSIQWCLSYLLPDFILDSWRLRVGISRRSESKKALTKQSM